MRSDSAVNLEQSESKGLSNSATAPGAELESNTEPNRFVRALAISMFVSAALFILYGMTGTPAFETNDDIGIMSIASGAESGEPSEFLIISSVVLGKLLKALYLTNGSVNWYPLFLYLVHFLAMTAVLFVLLSRNYSLIGVLGFMLLFFGFEIRFLLLLQFTTAAAVATIGGVLLIVHAASHSRGRALFISLTGVVLIFLGAIIREHAFYLVMLLSVPFVAIETLQKRSRLIPISVGAAILAALAAISYSNTAYSASKEWQEFAKLRTTLKALIRPGDMDYNSENRSIFDAVGWSKSDYLLFRDWFFVDEEIYSQSKLDKLAELFDARGRKKEDWRGYLRQELTALWLPLSITGANIVLALLLIRTPDRRFFYLVTFSTVFLIAGIIVYMAMFQIIKDHVSIPCLMFANVVTVYVMVKSAAGRGLAPTEAVPPRWRPQWLKRAARWELRLSFNVSDGDVVKYRAMRLRMPITKLVRNGFRVLLVLGVAYVYFESARNLGKLDARTRLEQQYFNEMTEKIIANYPESNRRNLFVLCSAGFPYEWCSPLAGNTLGNSRQIFSLGWMARSPIYSEGLRRHSIKHLGKELYTRDDLFMICGPGFKIDYANYVWEHFGEKITYEQETVFDFNHSRVRGPKTFVVTKAVRQR